MRAYVAGATGSTRTRPGPASVGPVSSLHPVSGSAAEILDLLRAWDAAVDPGPLVIATSGSTGRPKRVVLSREAMRASALATQDRLGGPGRWVLNLPPTYVAGVQVLYRSVVAGTEPLLEEGPAGPTHGRTYVSLVPTQLFRRLEDRAGLTALARFDAVLLGGGPLAPTVRAEAEGHGIRVVQTYGMSETCGGCVYDGRPLAGVDVQVGPQEEVLLRGPVLFDGYEDDPERTASALREGWFHTGDTGRLDPDGRLRVTGRLDDIIISGGVKVPGGAVAERLRSHPSVEEAMVLGAPDEEWGQRVVAFVVLAPAAGSVAPEAELRALFPEQGWAPKEYRPIDRVPLLANGKPDRVGLEGLL